MKNISGRTFKIIAIILSVAGGIFGFSARLTPGVNVGLGKTLYFTSIILVFSAIIPGLIWMLKED